MIAVKLLESKKMKLKLTSSVQPGDDCDEDNAQNSMALSPGVTKKVIRLSLPSCSPAKPLGSRDDPRDKIHAFLTEFPYLEK